MGHGRWAMSNGQWTARNCWRGQGWCFVHKYLGTPQARPGVASRVLGVALKVLGVVTMVLRMCIWSPVSGAVDSSLPSQLCCLPCHSRTALTTQYHLPNTFLETYHACLQYAQCNTMLGVSGWRSVCTYLCTSQAKTLIAKGPTDFNSNPHSK